MSDYRIQPMRKLTALFKSVSAAAFLASVLMTNPVSAQIERSNDASLLLRSASFGATIGTSTTYSLVEGPEGHWSVMAHGPSAPGPWIVTASPMSGERAGYVSFVNAEGEVVILDVLLIDACYGTAGEIRIGW